MTLQDTNRHTQAIADAIQRHEEYYKLAPLAVDVNTTRFTLVHVELPTPQVAGTYTQQRAYAVDKAQQILQNITSYGRNE